MKVRANEEDADELVEASESAVERAVSVDVEGRSSKDSRCRRCVRFAIGSDNMFNKFCVRVFDIAVQTDVLCAGAGAVDGVVNDDGDDVERITSLSVVGSCETCAAVEITVGVVPLWDTAGSIPGTIAAGTGGGAGSGDIGSLVGNSGCLISGNRLYRFSFGDMIFISRNFERIVDTHSCIASLELVGTEKH